VILQHSSQLRHPHPFPTRRSSDLSTQQSPILLTTLPSGKRFIAVACGSAHSLALADDGSIYGWGNNPSGQLGNGTTGQSASPVRSEEHTSELQSHLNLVCRLLLET